MHELDDSFRNQRKFRVRGKWELILVLLVVIAGVVVTTIAVLKAKEKRESLHQEEGLQVIDSSSPRLIAVDTQHEDKRQKEIRSEFKNADQRRNNNRYQAEKDFGGDLGGYESAPEGRRMHIKHTGDSLHKASNIVDSAKVKPRSRVGAIEFNKTPMLRNDGLPGYPAPEGFDPAVYFEDKQTNQAPNVEFSANSAGFVLSDIAASASEEQQSKVYSHAIPNAEPVRVNAVQSAPSWPVEATNPASAPVEIRPVVNKVHKIANGPHVMMATSSHISPVPTQNQDVFRVLGYDNGNYLSANEMMWLQQTRPEIFQSSLDASKSVTTNRRFRRDLMYTEQGAIFWQKPLRAELIKQTVLEESESRSHSKRRRYLSNYENDDAEDTERNAPQMEKKKHRKKKAKNVKNQKSKNKNKYKYSKQESKKVEKFDILGSGNFEIIRGGILDKSKEAKGYKLKSESEEKNRKIDKKDRPESGFADYGPTGGTNEVEAGNGETEEEKAPESEKEGEGEGEAEGEGDNFEPFNFDLFGSDPLGFQGYDNFDASKDDFSKVRM